MKRPHYFDMPLKKRLPLTAIICVCLLVIPPFIVGFIGHWPESYYKDVPIIYGFVIFISILGELNALSRRKKDRDTARSIEENSVTEEFCNYLWYVSVLLAGLWIFALIGAIAGWQGFSYK